MKFDNTCEALSASLAAVPSIEVKCSGYFGECPEGGTVSEVSDELKVCSFYRKLCVSCYDESGVVKIRTQSNGLPSTCYQSKSIAPKEV